ncbi:MAG: prolipoprotein diacylglyceryl transferase [Myxococcales bacterium]
MADNDIPGIPPQAPPPGSIPQEPPPSAIPLPGGAPQQSAPVAQGSNIMAILGLVAGILAVLCVFVEWIPIVGGIAALVGLLLGTAAIVLSVMGRKAAYNGLGGQGTAMGGLIMGIIGVVFALLMGTCQAVCWSGIKSQQDRLNSMTPEEREQYRKESEKQWQRSFERSFDGQKRESSARSSTGTSSATSRSDRRKPPPRPTPRQTLPSPRLRPPTPIPRRARLLATAPRRRSSRRGRPMWPVWAQTELFGHPLRLTGYGVFAMLGAALAALVCVRNAKRFGIDRFDAFAGSAIGLAFGVIGAKLLFLAVSVDRIRERGFLPLLTQGGLVWYGGLILGTAAVLVFLRGYRIPIASFADCAAPAIALGHAFGRVGCFMGGCCWGRPTNLPWAVRFPASDFFEGPVGVLLHPVQLYEALAELALAVLVWRLGGKVKKGGAFAVWLGSYALVRLAMELFFRADDRGAGLWGAPPSVGLSLLALLAAMASWFWPREGLTTEKTVC